MTAAFSDRPVWTHQVLVVLPTEATPVADDTAFLRDTRCLLTLQPAQLAQTTGHGGRVRLRSNGWFVLHHLEDCVVEQEGGLARWPTGSTPAAAACFRFLVGGEEVEGAALVPAAEGLFQLALPPRVPRPAEVAVVLNVKETRRRPLFARVTMT